MDPTWQSNILMKFMVIKNAFFFLSPPKQKKVYKDQMEFMLQNHVFTLFRSELGYMRARVSVTLPDHSGPGLTWGEGESMCIKNINDNDLVKHQCFLQVLLSLIAVAFQLFTS